MKKAVKIPLFIAGALGGLLLLASVLAGPIAKNYVEKHDNELIGREVNVGKIRVNPFSGNLKIKELTLFEDDGATPFVRFDRFETKIRVFDLFRSRLWVKHATLSGLQVNVEQNRDWFNFNSLIVHFNTGGTASESSGYKLVLNDINIAKSTIRYADLALGNEVLLRDISLRLPSLDLSDMNTDLGLDFALSDGATLHTDLHLSDNAEKYFINLKMNNLDIETIEPYLQQYYPIDLLGGRVQLDLTAHGLTDHIMDFDLAGNLIINGLEVNDTKDNPLCRVDTVFAGIKRFSLNDKMMEFNQLHCSGLKTAYVVNADSTTNFQLLLDSYRHSDEAQETAFVDSLSIENQEDKHWTVSIADLKFNRGEVAYEDHTLPHVFRYEIGDISLSSNRFTLDGNNCVRLQAALNKVGKLQLNWQGSLGGCDNHNLTLMLNNLKMADFSPYAVQLFGFPLEDGTLSFQSQNVISDGNLNGINKLRIASPKVGDRLKTAQPRYVKVPLKLGLNLLADKNNSVSVDLPVSGNLADPTFSYGKTLAKLFANLLSKAASAPFRLLTDKENNLQYIPFDLLQLDFSPEQYMMIDNIAATLQSRSDMAVVLEAQVQYDETIKQLCIMQLQRDYYLSMHPETTEADLDFMANEAIRSIKLNDKGLCDFAAQYSEKKRLHSPKDVTSVALAVYQEKAKELLPRMVQRHNQSLSDYLLNVKGLSVEKISVTSLDASLMKSFAKPSRYEMHVITYEDLE